MASSTLDRLKKASKFLIKVIIYPFAIILILSHEWVVDIFYNYLNMDVSFFRMVNVISGIIIAVIAYTAEKFNKFLWENPIIRKFLPKEHTPPIISGRWEGKIKRKGKTGNGRKFVIEITQTYTHLKVITFSNKGKGKSESLMADLLYNDETNTYQLLYVWEYRTREDTTRNGDRTVYTGVTRLDLKMKKNDNGEIFVQRLKGDYFTGRPTDQSTGTLSVRKVGDELLREFNVKKNKVSKK